MYAAKRGFSVGHNVHKLSKTLYRDRALKGTNHAKSTFLALTNILLYTCGLWGLQINADKSKTHKTQKVKNF